MPQTSQEIIKYLSDRYPQNENPLQVNNLQDQNFNFGHKLFYQYIIGVADAHIFSGDTEYYQEEMKQTIGRLTPNVHCIPFSYSSDEVEEMKQAINELAIHFNIKLDVDKLMNRLKIRRDVKGRHYIIITIVTYVIVTSD